MIETLALIYMAGVVGGLIGADFVHWAHTNYRSQMPPGSMMTVFIWPATVVAILGAMLAHLIKKGIAR